MKENKKTLILSATVWVTIETFITPFLKELTASDLEVVLIADQTGSEVGKLPINVKAIHLPMARDMHPLSDARSLVCWVQVLRNIRPDCVVGSTPKAGLLSLLAARITGVPNRVYLIRGAVWDGHTGIRARLSKWSDRVAVKCATDVLAVSKSLSALFIRERICDKAPLVLLNGGSKGVDLRRFYPGRKAEVSKDSVTLGYIGRLTDDKGVDILPVVLNHVSENFESVKFLVVGEKERLAAVSDSTLTEFLRDTRVEWIQRTPAPEKVMQQLDLLVFPSHREGLPNVVIEAAACGVPTIAWDVTGSRDAIKDGESGRVVAFGDRDSFLKGCDDLLKARGIAMSDSCREFAMGFDQKLLVREFTRFLIRLID